MSACCPFPVSHHQPKEWHHRNRWGLAWGRRPLPSSSCPRQRLCPNLAAQRKQVRERERNRNSGRNGDGAGSGGWEVGKEPRRGTGGQERCLGKLVACWSLSLTAAYLSGTHFPLCKLDQGCSQALLLLGMPFHQPSRHLCGNVWDLWALGSPKLTALNPGVDQDGH